MDKISKCVDLQMSCPNTVHGSSMKNNHLIRAYIYQFGCNTNYSNIPVNWQFNNFNLKSPLVVDEIKDEIKKLYWVEW